MGTFNQDQLRAWSASFDVVVGLLAFGLLGWLIDRWTGHAPWWMLGLGMLGLGAGVYKFIRTALMINAAGARKASRRRAASRERAEAASSSRQTEHETEKPGPDGSPEA